MGARARWAAVVVLLGIGRAGAAGDGAALYKTHCAACHGDVPAPKFVGRSVEDVKKVIAEGKGRMRPVALPPADMDAIARFAASPDRAETGTSGGRRGPEAAEKIAAGDRFAAAHDEKRALDAYLDAVNLDSTSAAARLKLAGQYQRMGHPVEAVRQWELVQALEPGNEEAARGLREAAARGER